ncbi:MAG: hypothetical protein HY720_27095 [Planctomycetes bacterium]|nr:hypothetical protein [Planctomycetota bacterium]
MNLPGKAALAALLALLAVPARGQLVIEAVSEKAGEETWSLRVSGQADYSEGVVLIGCLKAAHDAERVLDRRSCPVSSGRYEIEFGPYPAPLFPYEHAVSVLFSPGQQPEGTLGGTRDPPPGAVEIARSYRPAGTGSAGTGSALAEETSRVERLLGQVEELARDAEEILDGPAPAEDAALRALDAWRTRYEDLRGTRARAAKRWAFPAYIKTEGEIHVLVNHLIDLAYALSVREGGEIPEVGPPALRPIGPTLATARRAFAYEAVLLDPDPDRAVLEYWALPLQRRFESLAAAPRGTEQMDARPRDAQERLALFEALAGLARHREELHRGRAQAQPAPNSEGSPWILWSNGWFLDLAETAERLERDLQEPPFDRLSAARMLLARAGLALVGEWQGENAPRAGADFASVAAQYVQTMGLASQPRDAFGAHLALARALADEVLASPGPENSDEWDARALRLLEETRRPLPESLASLVETPPDLAARIERLSRLVATLAAHRERLELAREGEPYPEAAGEAATLQREMDELSR